MDSALNRVDTAPATERNGGPAWADDETLRHVRPEVRGILEAAPAFKELSREKQRELAAAMVKVASYMANPDGLAAEELSEDGGILAEAQADAVEDTKKRLSKDPGFAGKDFEAGAVEAGVEQFGQLVQKVDFPMFVSGLIQNVFQAIVDSSIQQMEAYGELVANVAKTVDEFARDNITENNARDWMQARFPDQLSLVPAGEDPFSSGFAEGDEAGTGEGGAGAAGDAEGTGGKGGAFKLEITGDNPEQIARQISEELGLAKPVNDLSDPAQEARLVQAARLQIARSRQQLLSSMVILGINRIVVTDGLIHAKVIFDMRARDVAQRAARASMADRKRSASRASVRAGYGSWFSPWSASASASTSTDHVTTVQSSVEDQSESRAEVKARLSGEVRVNFKSDHFPMEKLATPEMIAAIQGNAEPLERPTENT